VREAATWTKPSIITNAKKWVSSKNILTSPELQTRYPQATVCSVICLLGAFESHSRTAKKGGL